MPAPPKRKRKPLPKRACPCCSALLSEKTIERHLGGRHVPNRIQVTRAAASSHPHSLNPTDSIGDLSSDVASDVSDVSSDVSSVSSDHSQDKSSAVEIKRVTVVPPFNDINPPFNNINPPFNDPETNLDGDLANIDPPFNDPDTTSNLDADLAEIIQNTWSRRRVDNYDEDTEDGSLIDDEEHDSDLEFELGSDETEMRNGLGLDDLVNEDFQRIISEFRTSFLLLFRPTL